MAEVRNDSDQAERAFAFGTQYVDEPVCMGWNYYPQTDNSCFTTSDRHYIYHQDANYNVVALTWGRAHPYRGVAMAEHYDYDPYGQARIHLVGLSWIHPMEYWTNWDRSLWGNPFTYTGRWLDDESGLMYYRGRIYNPPLGRFNQKDPMGALATSPTELVNRGAAFAPVYAIPGTEDEYHDGLNLYQYVGSSPLSGRDPSGCIYDFGEEIDDIILDTSARYIATFERLAAAAEMGNTVRKATINMLQAYLSYQSPLAGLLLTGVDIHNHGLTWGSALALGTDAVMPGLKGLQMVGRAWKYRRAYLARGGGIGSGALKYAKRLKELPGHHPIPRFMGGDRFQKLVPKWMLPHGKGKLHQQYHSGLNKVLRKHGFPADRARGGGAGAWRKHLEENPGSQMQAYDLLIGYTRKFDSQHGTTVLRRIQYSLGLGRYKGY